MGPLPKRKMSRRRRGNRRAHDALTLRHLVRCDHCNEYKPAHVVCPSCGFYNGEQIVEVKEKE
jgi:large subunit ribosomal protein L32